VTADPVSYLLIERGWEVVASDGERVGDVDEVLADMNADIFDGLTVDQGLTKRPRYVPSERVAEILEGRVVLDAPAAAFDTEFTEWTGTPPG
jgi:uncharacterized protein YrrD